MIMISEADAPHPQRRPVLPYPMNLTSIHGSQEIGQKAFKNQCLFETECTVLSRVLQLRNTNIRRICLKVIHQQRNSR